MSTEGDRKPGHPVFRWKWILGLAIVAVAIALAVHFQLAGRAQSLLQAALDWIKELGSAAPVLFVVLYVISCVAMIPGSVLTIGGGAIFGLVQGSLYVSIGATLGATAAFLVGRYFARDWVERKLGRHPTFAAIGEAVAKEGWKIVFLTRLCPIFPFFLLNYGYGLTRVSLRHYVVATWIGIMPASTLLVYVGSLANAGAQHASPSAWVWTCFFLGTSILTMIYIARLARRALSKRITVSGNERPGQSTGAT